MTLITNELLKKKYYCSNKVMKYGQLNNKGLKFMYRKPIIVYYTRV